MILNFNQIKKEDILIVGGKGANLGELVSLGVNIPDGFVLTTSLYKYFIEENGIDKVIAKKLSEAGGDQTKLLKAASCFRHLIKYAQFSERMKTLIKVHYFKLSSDARVAVRSSATAEDLADVSFAGQQETYLNVKGVDAVLTQIKNCYASLWSDRAVIYRINQAYDQTNLAIAVIIQKMVDSEKAGVLFTVNPITNKQTEILINANYGLGESVVSGRATADNYVVSKSGEIIDITIGKKETQVIFASNQTKEVAVKTKKSQLPVLNNEEIFKLLKIGQTIEKHYGFPVDIEWAIMNNSIYILQARAITTLEQNQLENRQVPSYIKNVKIKKHNRELMSFLIEKIPFVLRALEFDYFTIISEQKLTILEEIGLTVSKNIVMDTDGLMSIRREKAKLNRNIVNIFKFFKSIHNYDDCAKQCHQFLDKYRVITDQYKTLDFERMTLAECKDFLIDSFQLTKAISYSRFRYAVVPSMLEKRLKKAVKKVNKQYTTFDLYAGVTNKTSQSAQEMLKMASAIKQNSALKDAILIGYSYHELCQKFPEFKHLTDHFLNAHGYTADYVSYCVSAKSFLEDPDRILKFLKPLISRNSVATNKHNDKHFAELSNALKDIYGNKYSKLADRINHFRYFHYVREEGHYFYETIDFYLRKCLKRINILLLGNENYQQGIANLFYDELIEVLNNGQLNDLEIDNIEKRNANLPFAQKVWDASKLVIYNNKGETLTGLSGNKGVAVGKACLVNSPAEFYKMQKGDVLVCPFTAPEWTSLFKLASAVVADTGSSLSHAAIVAREFGIPAVLGVGYATTKFKDGDMLKVDGNKGEVIGL